MPDQMHLSIGGESVPFTMQAEVGHMTMAEAIASGLFDLPDEPGMVRIPVSLNVWLPESILNPQPLPPDGMLDETPGAPSGGRHRNRFGRHPKATAAKNVARSFQTAQSQSGQGDFRALLDALHPQRGPRAPDDTPIQLVQDEEPLEGRAPDGRELSVAEAVRMDNFNQALRKLRAIRPDYSTLQGRDWMPDDAAVANIEAELRAAQAAAAAKADGAPAHIPTMAELESTLASHMPPPPPDDVFGNMEPPATPSPTGKPQDAPAAGPQDREPPPPAKPDKPEDVPPPSDSNTAANPPIRLRHIIDGDINKRGEAGGFHLRSEGKDPATARMIKLRDKPNSFGIYTGYIAVKDPVTGTFIDKINASTFFPDSFTENDVAEAILTAFRNSGLKGDGRFRGDTRLGFRVGGWYDTKKGITAAYPLRENK